MICAFVIEISGALTLNLMTPSTATFVARLATFSKAAMNAGRQSG
jgi:hypothetical protein